VSNPNVKVPKWVLQLEDTTIEGHAKTYPEELRENFIWLAIHIRENCNRNLDVLEAQMGALGFKTTGGTISKMLCGRWNKNVEGETVPPIIASEGFNALVKALRKDAEIAELSGAVSFVETETWDKWKAYVDFRRAPGQICKFGLGIGPTGSQKTACTDHYVTLNNHGRCNRLEAPDTATMGKFVTEMGSLFGVSPSASQNAKRIAIRKNLTPKKCVFIDNIQRLWKPNYGWNQPIMNALQAWQDVAHNTFILLCVPEWEMVKQIQSGQSSKELNYFEQFIGRCGGADEFFWFDDYATNGDLKRIANAFKLKDAEKYLPQLRVISQQPGRIRVLFHTLQKAKRISEGGGSKQLRMEHIYDAVKGSKTLNEALRNAEDEQ
jgi:hypothetical protein